MFVAGGFTMASAESNLRVLIVEDNPDGADTMSALLRIGGFSTEIARDGLEALEAADRIQPDVVLLDIGLPKVNGYDVCRHIRATPWGKNTAVIAVTGWGQEEVRAKSTQAGVDLHLVKPVRDADLLRAVGSFRQRAALRHR
jgi:CheY-like chemotaxis protein